MKTQPKPIHGAPEPVDVPSDMQDTPPQAFPFSVGEEVTYTNGNGLTSRARIRGFANPPHGGDLYEVKILGDRGAIVGRQKLKAAVRFVYLEHWSDHGWRLGAWWFAVGPESISKPTEIPI